MSPVTHVGREALRSELARAGIIAPQIRNLSDKKLKDVVVVARSSIREAACFVRDDAWVWPKSMFPVKRSERTITFSHLVGFPRLINQFISKIIYLNSVAAGRTSKEA